MASKKLLTFEYNGQKFECDEKACTSYKNTKRITEIEKNPIAAFDALEEIFAGKDEEYAEMLGGDASELFALYLAAAEACGAKNS